MNYAAEHSGKYLYLELLHRKSLVDVWLAEHKELMKTVAIKILYLSGFGSIQERVRAERRFYKEAQIQANLEHRFIMQPIDLEREHDRLLLILPYAPLGPLSKHHAPGQRLPLQTVKMYVGQIARALQFMHNRGFIHRDVKPGNILLKAENHLLLSDFGLAMRYESPNYTRMNLAFGGTSLFMAPEQSLGRPCPASDQYALATMAFEWLTGQRPFNGTLEEIIRMRRCSNPPSVRLLVHELPRAVSEVIKTGLQREPERRYATIMDFALAFEDACKPVPVRLPYYAPRRRNYYTSGVRRPAPTTRYSSMPVQQQTARPPQPILFAHNRQNS
ncbi:MAG TPA: serine/threonine-protein kinase [Ktedonobacteraceae bacterium]